MQSFIFLMPPRAHDTVPFMPKYYITTPIYYINDKPHIGHAYATIVADALARYHALKGDETFFLTGTDENSLKNVEAAKKLGYTDIQKYLDLQSDVWKKTWQDLAITNSDFIRTTEERHKKGVEKFFSTVYGKGDIYKGTYRGFYCTGCEAFVRESDLTEDGLCPFHKRKPDVIEEENYFFRCSAYRDALLDYIEKNPEFIEPAHRRNEIVNYIRDHFEDISISRQSLEWGIPLPIDPAHVVYVWFDALINYLTGVGYGWNEELFEKWWPADAHIVGKDIIKFHCALWPAMLLSAGLPLPKKVFAHGFFTIDGQRIGKSLGNAIDPVELSRQYGRDSLRYFLLAEIPFGGDGDFSFDRVRQRYESDLSKGLGNFVSRVTTLACSVEQMPDVAMLQDDESAAAIEHAWSEWERGFEEYELDRSLAAIWGLLRWGDQYIDKTKPWSLAKNDPDQFVRTMTILSEVLRHIRILIAPILPSTADRIDELLVYGQPGSQSFEVTKRFGGRTLLSVKKASALFPPL